jgi:hypothetical protein
MGDPGRLRIACAARFASEFSVKMTAGGEIVGFVLSRSRAAARRSSNVPLRFACPIIANELVQRTAS